VELDGQERELLLWDTTVLGCYDELRPLSYSNTHILLICYSVDNQDSLEHTEQRWLPEVCHFCPGTPFLLVACKLDLREEREKAGMEFVSIEQGDSMAKRIGAKAYVECSAMTGEGVSNVFRKAALVASGHWRPRPLRRRSGPSCIPF
jgi:Ras homolog gene family, member A